MNPLDQSVKFLIKSTLADMVNEIKRLHLIYISLLKDNKAIEAKIVANDIQSVLIASNEILKGYTGIDKIEEFKKQEQLMLTNTIDNYEEIISIDKYNK